VSEVFLSLGSNLGDRAANLWEAVRRIAALPDCAVVAQSQLYESEPVGPVTQGWFLNAVISIETEAEPLVLLTATKEIERSMGRRPGIPWGPRVIDIDLLLYEDVGIESEELTLPHREIWNRRFVLLPLLEVMPDCELRRRCEVTLEGLEEAQQEVRLYVAGDGMSHELAS
jgi:2-amino-4-hydroxy-6-hydroxymethyldihydropteridine diphosphokinase